MANVPIVLLNNGEKMPGFGLGTFEVRLHNEFIIKIKSQVEISVALNIF